MSTAEYVSGAAVPPPEAAGEEPALSDAGVGDVFANVLERNLSRRDLLRGAAVAAAVALVEPVIGESPVTEAASTLNFQGIDVTSNSVDTISVAPGHSTQVLVRWGDPVLPDAPPFNPLAQTAEAQMKQVGYNCDFLMYMPLPPGSNNPNHGLLWINHEYTSPELMFPGYNADNPTQQQVDVELAAHGASVVEIMKGADGRWSVVPNSPYARRIHALTPMMLTGPVRGHDWVKTGANPDGTTVLGMLNNCGGGLTPWGTILTCEENFQQYFANVNRLPDSDPRKGLHRRYGIPGGASERKWETYYSRFDVTIEHNEPNRFGWVVEVDPYDPTFIPRKRTALGRVLHEAATCVVTPSGRVVVYTGDDARFEYCYKFVTARAYNPNDRAANLDLLDEGTLYVAKFNDDGTGQWLPLVFGQGPLTPANGFHSQADVLVRTRMAADAVGATKMDRPEDLETNPVTKKVYMAMTNNTNRGAAGQPGPDKANPRANNRHGHIIEVTETNNDHAATTFTWSIFMLCGDPNDPSTYFAGFPKDRITTLISSPDNLIFDTEGNLWVLTDGMPSALQKTDGAYAVPVEGPNRGYLKRFFGGVAGCEIASGIFNTDSTALFLSVQHPGEGGTYEKPISRWPDGTIPPRPSVVVAWNQSGGPVGVVGGGAAPAALPRTGEALPGTLGLAVGAAAAAAGALVRLRTRGQRKEQEQE